MKVNIAKINNRKVKSDREGIFYKDDFYYPHRNELCPICLKKYFTNWCVNKESLPVNVSTPIMCCDCYGFVLCIGDGYKIKINKRIKFLDDIHNVVYIDNIVLENLKLFGIITDDMVIE